MSVWNGMRQAWACGRESLQDQENVCLGWYKTSMGAWPGEPPGPGKGVFIDQQYFPQRHIKRLTIEICNDKKFLCILDVLGGSWKETWSREVLKVM